MKELLAQIRKTITYPGVWVGALGYFVDLYDLVMFGIVRVESLKSFGLSPEQIQVQGAAILNSQMLGMLLGGLMIGYAADRLGRIRVLYFSILLYSLANIGNGFVNDLTTYTVLRFFAGVGLAGEFGVAITLVAESLPPFLRGIGTSVVGLAGFMGAASSVLTSRLLPWRELYWVGGGIGILLLIVRIQAPESPLYAQLKLSARGKATALSTPVLLRALLCVGTGMPIWFVSGLVLYFSPEIAAKLGVNAPVLAGTSIFWGYVGSLLGDIVNGILSQKLQSRKRVIRFAISLCLVLTLSFLLFPSGASPTVYYALCFLYGLGLGCWALFATLTSEQFETSIRGTYTTLIPNIVRATAVPMVALFTATRVSWGDIPSVVSIGLVVCGLALFCLSRLREDFSRGL